MFNELLKLDALAQFREIWDFCLFCTNNEGGRRIGWAFLRHVVISEMKPFIGDSRFVRRGKNCDSSCPKARDEITSSG